MAPPALVQRGAKAPGTGEAPGKYPGGLRPVRVRGSAALHPEGSSPHPHTEISPLSASSLPRGTALAGLMAQRRTAVLLQTPCPALLRAGVRVGASAGSCPLLGRLPSPAPHLAPKPSRARSLPGAHLRWAAPPGLQEGGLRWGGDPSWGKDRPVREDIFWAIGRVLRVLVPGMGASWGRKRPEG